MVTGDHPLTAEAIARKVPPFSAYSLLVLAVAVLTMFTSMHSCVVSAYNCCARTIKCMLLCSVPPALLAGRHRDPADTP